MFNKFTERARKVMLLAKQEAKRFNHDYIGPEHILLGIVKEGTGVAVRGASVAVGGSGMDVGAPAHALPKARRRASAAMTPIVFTRDLQLLVFISRPPAAQPLVRSFLGE